MRDQTPLRVLLVEDSPDDGQMVIDHLTDGGFEVESLRVDSARAMQDALESQRWHLVISDHSMPQFDAPSALALLRSSGDDLPFIIVSGSITDADAVAAMRSGAHDYILKDNLSRLAAVVERELAEADQRRERRAAERRLEYIGRHDLATGLPNRVALETALASAAAEVDCVVVVGVERLDTVADAFGSASVVRLLNEAATRISGVNGGAPVARVGEDRLGCGIEGPSPVFTQRIAMLADEPFVLDGQSIALGFTLGVCDLSETGEAEGLLRHAETALRLGRRLGQPVSHYRTGMEIEGADRLALLGELQRAVADDALAVAYQPKVDLRTGDVRGMEALVRWNHATWGQVSPGTFIPLAEQAGFVNQVTRWVLEAVFRQQAAWLRSGIAVPVAVNLSAQDLSEATEGFIADRARVHRIPLNLVRLEVTESAVMADLDNARSVLGRLDEAGVHVALDDFGTGYSALSHLRALPVRELKVDRSFVVASHESARDRAILAAVVGLGHTLGLEVVAEGIEDQPTLDILRAMDCPTGQGYFFARPMWAAEVPGWLHAAAARREQMA